MVGTPSGATWPADLLGRAGSQPHVVALLERCHFPVPGSAVVCAVSGGADSAALLVLAALAGCAVEAVHVDHGLRAGSAAEADVVRRLADQVGADFRSEQVVVAPGPNLEARAREARRRVLPADCLFGHTADDQAETVVLNLVRGAGLAGSAGIRDAGTHPIIGLRRHETRRLCRDLGVAVVHDPSNDDTRFRRNRVRHDLLPLLNDLADRDVVPIIARHAQLAGQAADWMESAAAAVDVTDARSLRDAPPALARLAVHEWLRQCSDQKHPPSVATVDRVLAVANLESTGTDVGRGWRVERRLGRLHLVPPS